jgi:hypothetical protein
MQTAPNVVEIYAQLPTTISQEDEAIEQRALCDPDGQSSRAAQRQKIDNLIKEQVINHSIWERRA